MKIKLSAIELKELLLKSSFDTDGDGIERQNANFIRPLFSNCEQFWKLFIIPATNRIVQEMLSDDKRIRFRDVSNDIKEISSLNYSIFLNFLYAINHLNAKHISYFENFYTHLGTICDLSEDFLLKIYFIILECEKKETIVLQKLSKNDFIKIAEKWYDEYYLSAYQHYLSKGKPSPIKLPSRTNVLDEFMCVNPKWIEYKRHSQLIREYRNVIVHNYQIAQISIAGRFPFVPKKNKIQNYKTWSQVFSAQTQIDKFRNDFVNKEKQMLEDVNLLEKLLNDLWDTPISRLSILLYDERNSIIADKYNFELT